MKRRATRRETERQSDRETERQTLGRSSAQSRSVHACVHTSVHPWYNGSPPATWSAEAGRGAPASLRVVSSAPATACAMASPFALREMQGSLTKRAKVALVMACVMLARSFSTCARPTPFSSCLAFSFPELPAVAACPQCSRALSEPRHQVHTNNDRNHAD